MKGYGVNSYSAGLINAGQAIILFYEDVLGFLLPYYLGSLRCHWLRTAQLQAQDCLYEMTTLLYHTWYVAMATALEFLHCFREVVRALCLIICY